MPVRTRPNLHSPGLFFVTATVVDWTRVFERPDVAVTVLEQFAETSRLCEVSIVGYVLMPSHLHALVALKDGSSLSVYMQAFKSLSSRKIKEMEIGEYREILYRSGRYIFWRRGFDDLLIRSEKQFRMKLAYIHNNPVKAGLVAEAVNYPYSSARDWLGVGRGTIEIDKEFTWL